MTACGKAREHSHSWLCAFVKCCKNPTAKSGCATKTDPSLTFSAACSASGVLSQPCGPGFVIEPAGHPNFRILTPSGRMGIVLERGAETGLWNAKGRATRQTERDESCCRSEK